MDKSLIPFELPLAFDVDGVLRVANTRVRMETVITAFDEGATPEEIVQDYPPLTLADVYAVIGYYLQQPVALAEYMQERAQQQATVRQQNEARFPQQGIRARLLARHVQQPGQKDAA